MTPNQDAATLPSSRDDDATQQPQQQQKYFRPLGNRILVKRDDAAATTSGGLYIPATAQGKSDRGVVRYTGPGGVDLTTGKRVAVSVRVGDVVLFPRSAIELDVGGERLVMLNEPEVFAVEFLSRAAADAFGSEAEGEAVEAAVVETPQPRRRRRSDAGVKRGRRGKGVTFEITTTPEQPADIVQKEAV